MSLVSSHAPAREALAVSASGTPSQPPRQPQVANHGTSSQPSNAIESGKPLGVESGAAHGTVVSALPQLSASTQEFLRLIGEKPSAYVAAREIVLKGMVTTPQTMPSPPTATRGSKRGGRGGSRGRKSSLSTTSINREVQDSHTTTPDSTPLSGSRSSRGRGSGRGRGRAGTRLSKRKRATSEESEGSDISASYTPLATTTKSGRSIQKPTQFSPPRPSSPPSGPRRKRGGRRVLESSVCKVCSRGHSPNQNMIVFCDGCNTPYHQYCHHPPVSDEVIAVLDKEWFCGICTRSKESTPVRNQELFSIKPKEPSPSKTPPAPPLRSGEGLSYEQKSAYLTALPHTSLVSLLLSACARHPDLPLFDPQTPPSLVREYLPTPPTTQLSHTNGTPNSDTNGISSTPNLLNNASQAGQTQTIASSTAPRLNNATILRQDISNGKVTSKDTVDEQSPADTAEVLDAYDSDPPAHFPKPGHGLKLRPDNDDLEWLIDDNFEVFSHVYKVDERIGYLDGEREAYASTAR